MGVFRSLWARARDFREYKCHTPFLTTPALGHGSQRCGGAASQADGGRIALGNTEERLIVEVLGVPERGCPDEPPFDRTSGTGWVRATVSHQYADAQRRGNPVTLLVAESTGAISTTFAAALRALGRSARLATTHDSTVYGISRSSPRDFYSHHLAAHSSAVVLADATTILNTAAELKFQVSVGVSI